MDDYVKSGKRFNSSKQDADRQTVMDTLATEVNSIKKDGDFYLKIAQAINRARLSTQKSHREKSWSAWFTGWIKPTSSRLESRLDKFLDKLAKEEHLDRAVLQAMKTPPKTVVEKAKDKKDKPLEPPRIVR